MLRLKATLSMPYLGCLRRDFLTLIKWYVPGMDVWTWTWLLTETMMLMDMT